MNFEFTCTTCGEIHKGMPAFHADRPYSYYEVPEKQRNSRCDCGTDQCVIDDKWFFVRGCLEIPVRGADEPFVWGVWVSLSRESFQQWRQCFDLQVRSHIGPFFGWLNAMLKPYPNTMNLKTKVHLRDDGMRPAIELEPTAHPLAVEQRQGISQQRVAQLYSIMMHEK